MNEKQPLRAGRSALLGIFVFGSAFAPAAVAPGLGDPTPSGRSVLESNQAATADAAQTGGEDYDESVLLSRIRQLTFDGRRAGEGYFSPDGTHLTLQSERQPGNPFYQIYELSFESGDTRRISPGTGKTTCAFYRPGTHFGAATAAIFVSHSA